MECRRHGKLSPVTMRAVLTDMFRSGISENKHLFNALDENKEYPPSHHVAETVAYLGLPPLHFL